MKWQGIWQVRRRLNRDRRKAMSINPKHLDVNGLLQRGRSILHLGIKALEWIDQNKDDINILLGRVKQETSNGSNINNEQQTNSNELRMAKQSDNEQLETSRHW